VPIADLVTRASRHAALGDPIRLAIADELVGSDRSPAELRLRFGLESNLLSHHLDVLEGAGLIERFHSSGDGRRRYVHLRDDVVGMVAGAGRRPVAALFVCTANSARSQLAAAIWTVMTGRPARSAGTHPAAAVAPGALAAARRAGLAMENAIPQSLDDVARRPALVVTVCDRAHEALTPDGERLHWSIPDPVPGGTTVAFDRTVAELRTRVSRLIDRTVAA
jgi:protein-tyrosine-phosphatase